MVPDTGSTATWPKNAGSQRGSKTPPQSPAVSAKSSSRNQPIRERETQAVFPQMLDVDDSGQSAHRRQGYWRTGVPTSGSAGGKEPHHPELLDNQQHEFDLGDAH
jgi:hypothetical protein